VTNTIVYSHDTGLSQNDSATLIENYNLLSNTNNYNGSFTTGSNDMTGQIRYLTMPPGTIFT